MHTVTAQCCNRLGGSHWLLVSTHTQNKSFVSKRGISQLWQAVCVLARSTEGLTVKESSLSLTLSVFVLYRFLKAHIFMNTA